MKSRVLLVSLFLLACSITPAQASNPIVIVVAGESNAAMMAPYIKSIARSIIGDVTVVNCAAGGSMIYDWGRTEYLYRHCIGEIYKHGGHVDVIFWHQGINDTVPNGAGSTWRSQFEKVVQNFRSDLKQKDLLFIVGSIGKSPGSEFPLWSVVRQSILSLKTQPLENVVLVRLDDLETGQDKIHYTPTSLREMDRRYLSAYAKQR